MRKNTTNKRRIPKILVLVLLIAIVGITSFQFIGNEIKEYMPTVNEMLYEDILEDELITLAEIDILGDEEDIIIEDNTILLDGADEEIQNEEIINPVPQIPPPPPPAMTENNSSGNTEATPAPAVPTPQTPVNTPAPVGTPAPTTPTPQAPVNTPQPENTPTPSTPAPSPQPPVSNPPTNPTPTPTPAPTPAPTPVPQPCRRVLVGIYEIQGLCWDCNKNMALLSPEDRATHLVNHGLNGGVGGWRDVRVRVGERWECVYLCGQCG